MSQAPDAVAEVNRTAGLDDDACGEVVGDAAKGQHDHDADEQGDCDQWLNLYPSDGQSDAYPDEQHQVAGDTGTEVAQIVGQPGKLSRCTKDGPPRAARGEPADEDDQ